MAPNMESIEQDHQYNIEKALQGGHSPYRCVHRLRLRLLLHDDLVCRLWMEIKNLLNWYTSTTNDMHIALQSARMSQYSVIIGDYFVKVNPDLQGPNE